VLRGGIDLGNDLSAQRGQVQRPWLTFHLSGPVPSPEADSPALFWLTNLLVRALSRPICVHLWFTSSSRNSPGLIADTPCFQFIIASRCGCGMICSNSTLPYC
jgi:hypothetical protein